MSDKATLKCPQCGYLLEKTDRYCIHCGYINYDNPDNKYLVKYEKNAKKIKKQEEKKEDELVDTSQLSLSSYEVKSASSRGSLEDANKTTGFLVKNGYKLFKLLIVFFLFVVLLFIYSYVKDKQDVYVEHAKKIVEEVSYKYEANTKCLKEGTYYYKFSGNDLEKKYNLKLKSIFNDSNYMGYVKVVNDGTNKKYYISLNDGSFGIREREVEKLNSLLVLPYNSVYEDIEDSAC